MKVTGGKKPGAGRPRTHDLGRFATLKWSDEEAVDKFISNLRDNLTSDEFEQLKVYLRTLAFDDSLNLTSFEIKRIALAMLMLDRADKWFLLNSDQNDWGELRIELHKFLQGKENMVINALTKARESSGVKPKSLIEQLDEEFKNGWAIEGEGKAAGVDYTFKAEKQKKPKMLTVEVTEDGNEDKEQSEEDEDSE